MKSTALALTPRARRLRGPFARAFASPLCLGLFLGGLLGGSGCAANPGYCDLDTECDEDSVCEGHSCQPAIDLDAGSDAQPEAPSSECSLGGGACAQDAPVGWDGPFQHLVADIDKGLVACDGYFPTEYLQSFSDIEESGACSCSCSGKPSSLECGPVRLTAWVGDADACESEFCEASTCSGTIALVDQDTCTDLSQFSSSVHTIKTDMPTITGGTCSMNPTVQDQSLKANFASKHRLCAPDAEARTDVCPRGENCFFEREDTTSGVCVARAGEHACPAGPYTERTVLYDNIDDQRSCSAGSCDCEIVPGGNCLGTVEIFDGEEVAGCQQAKHTVTMGFFLTGGVFGLGANICESANNSLMDSASFEPLVDIGACGATGQPQSSGSVVGLNPTTLCCLP